MSKLLLTTVESVPVIVKCESVADLQKFKKKGACIMSPNVFLHNKEHWTQKIVSEKKLFLADLLNKHLANYECWIRKEDAGYKVD